MGWWNFAQGGFMENGCYLSLKNDSVYGAAKTMHEFLHGQTNCDVGKAFDDTLDWHGEEKMPPLSWQKIKTAFDVVRLNKFPRHVEAAFTNIDLVIDLFNQRISQEDDASKDLSQEAFLLWQMYAPVNIQNLSGIIYSKLQAAEYDVLPMKSALALTQHDRLHWFALLEMLQDVQAMNPDNTSNAAETWEEFIRYRIPSLKAVEQECDSFGHCSFCWRLVPIDTKSEQHRLLCQAHQRGTQQNKIRGVHNAAQKIFLQRFQHAEAASTRARPTPFAAWLFDAANKRERLLRTTMRLDQSNLPENWELLWQNNIEKLAGCVGVAIQYDLAKLERILPYAFAFVREHGGDCTDPVSLIDILDPALDNERPAIRAKRLALHAVCAKNLMLFRRELCLADCLIEQYCTRYPSEHPPVC